MRVLYSIPGCMYHRRRFEKRFAQLLSRRQTLPPRQILCKCIVHMCCFMIIKIGCMDAFGLHSGEHFAAVDSIKSNICQQQHQANNAETVECNYRLHEKTCCLLLSDQCDPRRQLRYIALTLLWSPSDPSPEVTARV